MVLVLFFSSTVLEYSLADELHKMTKIPFTFHVVLYNTVIKIISLIHFLYLPSIKIFKLLEYALLSCLVGT